MDPDDEYGDILDMIRDDDGHFVMSEFAEDEVDPEPEPEPVDRGDLQIKLDAPATVAVATFSVGLLLGAFLRRRLS